MLSMGEVDLAVEADGGIGDVVDALLQVELLGGLHAEPAWLEALTV